MGTERYVLLSASVIHECHLARRRILQLAQEIFQASDDTIELYNFVQGHSRFIFLLLIVVLKKADAVALILVLLLQGFRFVPKFVY